MAMTMQAIESLYSYARRFEQKEVSLRDSVASACQVLLDAVECARLSLWSFEIGSDLQGMRCIWVKLRDHPIVDDHELITSSECASYFSDLARMGYFASSDVEIDDRLKAMRDSYLRKHLIRATLDVPIGINGRAYWLVCCEQVQAPYAWRASDITTARQLCSRTGLLISRMLGIPMDALHSIPFSADEA